MNIDKCETCIKKKTLYCPNSIECMATDNKPYYQNRIMILEENERLKRQLEELMKTNNVLTQELMKDSDIKQDYLTTCCGIPIGDIPSLKYENDRYKRLGFKHLNDENNKLLNQQKEFVNYLEDYLKLFDKKDIDEEGYYDCIEEILLKYEEIIGGENNESNL